MLQEKENDALEVNKQGRDSQEKKIIKKLIEKLIGMQFLLSDMSQLLQFLHFPTVINLNKFFNKFFNNFFFL